MRFVVFALGLLAVAWSCACVPLVTHPGYNSVVDWGEYNSSVRIAVLCPDQSTWAGTAVAVTSRHLLTAKHSIWCDGNGPIAVLARVRGGEAIQVQTEYVSPDTDVARLAVMGDAQPFQVRAFIRRRPVSIGEHVCTVGGDLFQNYGVRKCGDVAEVFSDFVALSIHVVPGNSGGGVYDRDGNVVGIVSRGQWDADKENVEFFVPVSLFREALNLGAK